MNIRCRNLFDLKCFKEIRLIAGEGGLDHIITWVYINQDTSITNWVHGGELVFITGMDNLYAEETLYHLVQECVENATAGVVILINDRFIDRIPPAVISLAEKNDMPLFEMPWNLKLVDVTREIADTIIMNQMKERSAMGFFSELLFSRHISEQSVKYMGIHCGVDVEAPAAMMILRPQQLQDDRDMIPHRVDYESVLSIFERIVSGYFAAHQITCVSCIYMDEIFFYMGCADLPQVIRICEDIRGLSDDYVQKHPAIRIRGGIGQVGKSIEGIRQSYTEARQAMNAAEKNNDAVCITRFSELGIIRLLADFDDTYELKRYCYCVLKPLINSDNESHTPYVQTLEAYLHSNCNLVKAAESLYIHRNTMVYRMDKIRELMHIDFTDMEAKSECMNALRIMRHFGITPAELYELK